MICFSIFFCMWHKDVYFYWDCGRERFDLSPRTILLASIFQGKCESGDIFFSDNGTYPEVHLQCECSVSDSPLFFFFALLVHGQLQCLSSFSPFWVSAQKHDLTTEKTPEFVMMSLLWWCSRVFAFLGFEREIVYFLFSPSLKWVLWGLEEVAESGQWWWGQREDDWKRVERVEEGSWREKGFSHF